MTSHGLTHEDHQSHKDHKEYKAFVIFVFVVSVVLAGVARCSAETGTSKFDSSRAYEDMRQMVSIGPRPSGSPAIAKTRDYIKKGLTAAGLTPEELPFDAPTPLGVVHMVNIRATLPGQAKDRGRLVIGGHYDTKLVREFPFVGASDGASSAAFLLELARSLKGRTNPLPIELLFLDGEEAVVDWQGQDHTYGSRHYVQDAQRARTSKDIRAFILVDMIGDRDLGIRRDSYSTPWLNDIIWGEAAKLKLSNYFLSAPTTVEDDHLPFLSAGVPSVDIIDLDYDAWHTQRDALDAVSARSLQVVGDVVVASLPLIETHLAR
jgi:Peptidase family M28